MAYKISNIDPIDLQPRKAVGVGLPLSVEGVFRSTYQSSEAIKTNLINFMLTGRGERYMNVNFGSSIRNYLFNQINTSDLKALEQTTREAIELNFPRVTVQEVSIQPEPDRNMIAMKMAYTVKQTNIADTISINFV